jgi:hypothetical protein
VLRTASRWYSRRCLNTTDEFSPHRAWRPLTPGGGSPCAASYLLSASRQANETPAISVWNNFAGRRVIRGGVADFIPLGGGGYNTFISQLAIGQKLTDHDVPLIGDFIGTFRPLSAARLPTFNIRVRR